MKVLAGDCALVWAQVEMRCERADLTKQNMKVRGDAREEAASAGKARCPHRLLELESLLRRRHVELRSSGLERDLKIIACAVWRGRQGARASDAAATGTHLPPPCDSMTH